jgi:glycosyltransferase involved in cell wall biosynthesis
MRLKIGIVMPLADMRGGAEAMLLYLLRANKQTVDMDYTVVFLENGPLANEIEALGYPVRVLEAGKLRQAGRYLSTVMALYAWLKQEKVNTVMSWMTKAHLYAGPAAFLARVDTVWYQHGISNSKSLMEKCSTYIPARAVICNSKVTKEHQRKMTPKLPAVIIAPAVDLEVYKPVAASLQEIRKKLGLPENSRIVGIVARLQRWKGVHIFLEAASFIAKEHPDVHFVIVGGSHFSETDYQDELEKQAAKAGITHQVHFAGYQANTASWMQAFDILVHASYGEPFGMVIIEGMASGKPVIATKKDGPLEIITDGENGLLIPPGDAISLALTIQRLIRDTDYCNKLSRAAMERAKMFSTKRMAIDMANLLALVSTKSSESFEIEKIK